MTIAADKKHLNMAGKKNDNVVNTGSLDENGEPMERDELPWLKDPSSRAGFYEILKNNMSKEFGRMSLPVYYNEPASMT